MEIEETPTLKDYFQIIKRRKYFIIFPMLFFLAITVVVAFALPPVYRSEATILIEQQHIPTNLVKSTVTSYADERIRQIEQRVMTVDSLNKLIVKYGLYQNLSKELSVSDLALEFRNNAMIELVDTDLIRGGRKSKATLAFKLSFSYKNSNVAQKIANELVTLFLDENIRARTERAKETTDFLQEETKKFKLEIQKIENQIAEYKEKYSNSLPELLPINLSSISRIESGLQQLDLQEKMLYERRVSLRTQLSLISPSIVHQNSGGAETPANNLSSLQARYQELLEKYAPSHPDIRAIKRKIDNFSEDSTGRDPEKVAKGTANPIYFQLKSEMDIAKIELNNILEQKNKLKEKLQQLEQRVNQTYQVERGYYELIRDLDNHKEKYKELKSKTLEAGLSRTLEEEQLAEKFTLIEPPRAPQKPEKPDRFKILMLGFAASIGLGLGIGYLAEMLDESIRGRKMMVRITGFEPLIVIPFIENEEDLAQIRKGKINFFILLFVLLTGMIAALHFFYMSLDLLWLKLWHRIVML